MTAEDKAQGEALRESFKHIAGEDLEIDAFELKEILDTVFTKGKLNTISFCCIRSYLYRHIINLWLIQRISFQKKKKKEKNSGLGRVGNPYYLFTLRMFFYRYIYFFQISGPKVLCKKGTTTGSNTTSFGSKQ